MGAPISPSVILQQRLPIINLLSSLALADPLLQPALRSGLQSALRGNITSLCYLPLKKLSTPGEGTSTPPFRSPPTLWGVCGAKSTTFVFSKNRFFYGSRICVYSPLNISPNGFVPYRFCNINFKAEYTVRYIYL